MPRILSSKMTLAVVASALLSSAATFSAMSAGHRHGAPEPVSVAMPHASAFATPAAAFHDASVPEASSVGLPVNDATAVDGF